MFVTSGEQIAYIAYILPRGEIQHIVYIMGSRRAPLPSSGHESPNHPELCATRGDIFERISLARFLLSRKGSFVHASIVAVSSTRYSSVQWRRSTQSCCMIRGRRSPLAPVLRTLSLCENRPDRRLQHIAVKGCIVGVKVIQHHALFFLHLK